MKKILSMVLCLLMATSMMVGCTSQDIDDEIKDEASVGDIAMSNTFEATITEINTESEVILATVEPVEGEEILSYGEYATVGLMKEHEYEIGDIIMVAYGKAFSDNGKIEFDNVTIKW